VIELFTVLLVSMPTCLHMSVDNETACRPLLTGIAVQWSWDKRKFSPSLVGGKSTN
jgi:hypothetical protein